jgi:hypothetical protein
MATLSDRTANVAETNERDNDLAVARRAEVDERLGGRRHHGVRAAATTAPDATTEVSVPAGPRPRASVTATIALIVGVTAVLTVLTGVLAGPAVALGLIAAFFGIAGVSATSRRHVAGRGIALLGILLGLGAVVVASLALTGAIPRLNGETDQVAQLRDWIQAQLPWMFPSA